MTSIHAESVGAPTARLAAPPPPQVVTLLLSSETKPFRAKALPFKLAPVFSVMLVSAKMFPAIVVVVSITAELVTCHHTPPQAEAPLSRTTDEPGAVVSELAILKMYSPAPVRVSVPVKFPAPMQ